jgi:hypothetical protein
MTETPLARLARRASAHPFFLGYRLAEYARVHEVDDLAIAARLGCNPELLATVRLCRAPRAGREEFREDVLCIATKFGLHAHALAEIAKYVPATPRLENTLAEPVGLVLAARDREKPL